RDVFPERAGFIAGMDTYAIGMGIVAMGGGRSVPSDKIDHAVGLSAMAQVGGEVNTSTHAICRLHARDENSWEEMAARLRSAVTVVDAPMPSEGCCPLILKRVT